MTEALYHPELSEMSIEEILKALGDPVRLSAVRQIAAHHEPELACKSFQHDVSKPTFSHHIKILREAGIIQVRHDGVKSMISLRKQDMEQKFPGLLTAIL